MSHHHKRSKCGCEKKNHNHNEHKKSKHTSLTSITTNISKTSKTNTSCTKSSKCGCECEQKYYFPLPNIPSQPVSGMRVGVDAWFAPGSVQSCCSICSTVNPVYANPCNTCRYDQGAYPINNTAYFTTSQYV